MDEAEVVLCLGDDEEAAVQILDCLGLGEVELNPG